MSNNVLYYRKGSHAEYVYYRNSIQAYPMHTHASHVTFGYVLGGEIRMICDAKEYLYHTGEYYCIMPDIPHAIEPVNDTVYSMICVCVSADKLSAESEKEVSYSKKLKQLILNDPENVFQIEAMARCIGVSPYHMIRQFKTACGLTPHQFQIQCRVRKAQKLLEAGISVTEAAYATGFYDQSHFDRCFHKIVRLTPNEYKKSVKILP